MKMEVQLITAVRLTSPLRGLFDSSPCAACNKINDATNIKITLMHEKTPSVITNHDSLRIETVVTISLQGAQLQSQCDALILKACLSAHSSLERKFVCLSKCSHRRSSFLTVKNDFKYLNVAGDYDLFLLFCPLPFSLFLSLNSLMRSLLLTLQPGKAGLREVSPARVNRRSQLSVSGPPSSLFILFFP